MNAHIQSEHVGIVESIHNGGVLMAETPKNEIIGEVEVIHRSKLTGKTVLTRTIHRNDLLVSGAVFLSEKINNMRSSFQTTPLDVTLNIHDADKLDRTLNSIPNEKVFGLMVGIDGCEDSYNTVRKVHRTNLAVPEYIPFRVVPLTADLEPNIRDNYFLRVEDGGYAYYYGKRFEITDNMINVQYEDSTPVPSNVDVIGDSNGKYIKTFTKYTFTIDENDIREWFKLTEGNTMRSRINSFGLVTGYPGVSSDSKADKTYEEAYNVRTMTTLNTENNELKDSESTITVVYRLYFV